MWRLRLVLLILLVGLVLAIRYLPGWVWLVILAVFFLLPLVLRLIIRWKVRSFVRELDAVTPPGMPPLFAALFKLKGSVLRNAHVVVHSVHPTEAPPLPPQSIAGDQAEAPLGLDRPALPVPDAESNHYDQSAEITPGRDYYLVDVTIKPTRMGIGFRRWQPGELALSAPDRGWHDRDDSCEIVDVQVQHDNELRLEEDDRYAGPQRLRLRIGVRPGVRRLVFRYYTEQFGELILPGALQLPAR